ncbi:hypothetical protein JCM1840_001450 [Sporobolomyces johnsonii]
MPPSPGSSTQAASSSLASWLGLAPWARPLHIVSLLSTCCLSISLLVFVSAASSFVLSTLQHVPAADVGDAMGRLILADELSALGMYFPAGAVADRWGVRWVAVAGYVVVAIALVLYVQARNVWELVAVRVLFAVCPITFLRARLRISLLELTLWGSAGLQSGAGALVATLSATLSSMTDVPPVPASPATRPSQRATSSAASDEREPLLSRVSAVDEAGELVSPAVEAPHRSARLAGIMGFASGSGALLAVFGFLRLPTLFATHLSSSAPSSPDPLVRGLVLAFYVVAALSLLEGCFVFYGLPGQSTISATSVEEQEEGLCRTSRAQTVVVTAYIPLLVNRYFLQNDLCTPQLAFSALAASDLPDKHTCRRAYVLASILTGIVQLLSLLCSPLIGLVSSSPALAAPQAAVLALTFLLGAGACAGFAFLPGDGDPRSSLVWLWAVGLGVSQAAGVVVSLALVTKGRGAIVAKEGREVGGALSAAYSFCGGE